ncbi:MAG: PGF-CTERM sorting domain-containing protein [Methanosarcinaceae archaeon]|nr:PGF-CTERM sorting domain-containing protein [Methanosarcinaceae archaeon]
MKPIKNIIILVMVAILSLSVATSALAAEEPVPISEDSQPDFEGCEMCHSEIAANYATSLHYMAYGMRSEYELGAAGHFGIDVDAFYEEACAGCHYQTCTKCHQGYIAAMGHGEETVEITLDTCNQCHLTKQSSTFIGDLPKHSSEGPHADIHYEKGLTCMDCHSPEEMHGDGTIYTTQQQAVTTACEDCHNSPGKVVKEMNVTQYTTEIPAHEIHDEKLDCAACHAGWMPTCVNCHLNILEAEGLKTTDGVVTDEFYLAKGIDGLIKPFLKQSTNYDGETHTAYAAWMPHTITDEPKDCAFCHENREVLCEGCEDEGYILGEGGSFIPQATIDRLIGAHITPEVTEPTVTEPTTPEGTPGFGFLVAFVGLLSAVLLFKRH